MLGPPSQNKNYAAQICDPEITDEDRLNLWLCIYYAQWNEFPVKQMNDAVDNGYKEVMDFLSGTPGASKAVNDHLATLDIQNVGVAIGICSASDSLEVAQVLMKAAVQAGLSKANAVAVRTMIAKGVATSTVGGLAKTGIGSRVARRGAVIVIEESATLLGGRAASKAMTALANPAVGLAAAIGEITAYGICAAFGVDDQAVLAATGAVAGVLTGIIAGGAAGGPLGMVAGGVIETVSVIAGAGIGGIFNAFKGGQSDNWCYVQVGDLRKNSPVSAGVYKGNDGWYMKTYQNKYMRSHQKDYFSAGNDQDEFFQVRFYDESGKEIKTYQKVWYRDTFFVSKNTYDGSLRIVYCRGGLNKEKPGGVDVCAWQVLEKED